MESPVAENKKDQIIAQANEQIIRLRAEIAGWESFVEAATQSPTFLPKLEAMLLDPKSNGVPHPTYTAPQRQPELHNWQRVWTYLMATGNNWTSIRQIMEGTGLKRDSVNGAVYTGGHKHIFETHKKETGRAYFRVKKDFADKDKVPLVSEQPDEEPQVAETNEVVGATPKPVPKPVPKHRPTYWTQNEETKP